MSAAKAYAGAVALVTGASSGIGREIARELAARGAGKIVLVARRRERLEALAQELGDLAVVWPCDLADTKAVRDLIAAHPKVDVLVNNAAFGAAGAVQDQAVERLLELVDVNCRALVQLTHAFLPGMIERKSGYVLNVGSIAGIALQPNHVAYAASKAFVNHWSESLRAGLRGTGVEVHLLAPGPVATEFFEVARPGTTIPAGMAGRLWIDAARVAKESLDAMARGEARHIPSFWVRMGISTLETLPKPLVRPLAGAASIFKKPSENPG